MEIGSWIWGGTVRARDPVERSIPTSRSFSSCRPQGGRKWKGTASCAYETGVIHADEAPTHCHNLSPVVCLPLCQIRGYVRRGMDALPYADPLCVLSAHNSERLIYFWKSKCLVARGEMSQILLPKDETIRSRSRSQHPHMAKYHRRLQLANSTPGKDSSALRSPIQLRTYYLLQ